MKSTDKPQISKKWWASEKPGDIKGQDLEKALTDGEKKLADAKKRGDADSIKAGLAAFESVASAADKTIKKECDKKKHKDLITVLEKFHDLCGDESKSLNKAMEALDKKSAKEDQEGEDEEEEKGILKPEYLARMIKLLRGGEQLQFCFGLNKSNPADSRLLLCNKRKPERLQKTLKSTGEFSNRLMTFGHATGDGKTIQFALSDNAKEPSQIVKLAKEFLKANKDLKYRKVRVLCGGEAFEEDMGDEGGAQEAGRAQASAAGSGAGASAGGFIGASVGKGGKNLPEDVTAVQGSLNKYGDIQVPTDGKFSPAVLKAIEEFQKKLGQFKPSGLIEPGRGAARVLSGGTKMPATPPQPQPIEPPDLGKASLDKGAFVWHSTRKILNTNIDELKKGVLAAYGSEHPELLKAIDASMAHLNKVVDKLDTRLADALDAAYKAPSDQARVPELKKAEGIMNEYLDYVKAEPLIDHMDNNPFGVKTSLKKVIADALKHLSQLLPEAVAA